MRPLAFFAILLTFGTIAGDLAAIASVPGYDPARQTISELAAGEGQRFEDLGLYALALALVLAGVLFVRGASLAGRDYAGIGFLLAAAVVISVIAGWNAYDAPGGEMQEGSFALAAHRKLVWILGGAFFGAATFLAEPLGRLGGDWRRRAGLAAAFIWLVTAPVFFFVPTSIDGLYERLLAALLISWIWLGASGALQPQTDGR